MLSDLRYRLRALFRRNHLETELDAELGFHFEQQVESTFVRASNALRRSGGRGSNSVASSRSKKSAAKRGASS